MVAVVMVDVGVYRPPTTGFWLQLAGAAALAGATVLLLPRLRALLPASQPASQPALLPALPALQPQPQPQPNPAEAEAEAEAEAQRQRQRQRQEQWQRQWHEHWQRQRERERVEAETAEAEAEAGAQTQAQTQRQRHEGWWKRQPQMLWRSPTAASVRPAAGVKVDEAVTVRPRCSEMPLAGSYVISSKSGPGAARLKRYQAHTSNICGFGEVTWHPAFVANAANVAAPETHKLAPGLRLGPTALKGNVGLGMAHLTLWDRIAKSESCARKPESYVMVAEDDELPRANIVGAVSEIINMTVALPPERQPDFINLNVLRPAGAPLGQLRSHSEPWPELLAVTKGEPCRAGPKNYLCNVWASLYLLRCGSAGRLTLLLGHVDHRHPNGSAQAPWDGTNPIFDRNIALACADPEDPIQCASVSPSNAISVHGNEHDSMRAGLNR